MHTRKSFDRLTLTLTLTLPYDATSNDNARRQYDLYDIQSANVRSQTLLAYLEDTNEGGETEFMKLQLMVKPRKGTALIWSDCTLQDVPAIDTREPGAKWDTSRGTCKAGGGDEGLQATLTEPQKGEYVQFPCCVGRDEQSLHQSRPVMQENLESKWTMTIWMHQRFAEYGLRRNVQYEEYRKKVNSALSLR